MDVIAVSSGDDGAGSGDEVVCVGESFPPARDLPSRAVHAYARAARQRLRFACSSVAAVAGLDEYADPVETVMRYLYQDLHELMMIDASNLNMSLVSEEHLTNELLQRVGKEGAATIASVVTKAASPSVKTAADVQGLRGKAGKAVQAAVQSKALSADQVRAAHRVHPPLPPGRGPPHTASLSVAAGRMRCAPRVRSNARPAATDS